MSRLQMLLGCMIFTFSLQAQSAEKRIAELFQRYENREGINTLQLNGSFFQSSSSDKTGGIQSFRMIKNKEGAPNPLDQPTFKQLLNSLSDSDYETLVDTREEDRQLRFYVRETTPGESSEAIIVSWSPENFLLISARGFFTLKDLQDLEVNVSGN